MIRYLINLLKVSLYKLVANPGGLPNASFGRVAPEARKRWATIHLVTTLTVA